jgi:hypothetical protein
MGFRRNEVVAIEKPADRTAWKGSGVATDSGSLSQNLSPLTHFLALMVAILWLLARRRVHVDMA